MSPVLVGSAGDDRPVARDEVEAATPAADVDLDRTDRSADARRRAGRTAAALVTNDSGAMHLAAALGVPVTAMFGPTDETATRPLGATRTSVLTHAVWCRPCMLRECPLDHRCMRGIAPTRDRARSAAL